MNNASIWEACQLYGEHLMTRHNNPALFNRWLSNYKQLETQLMVDTDGQKVEGTNKYTDGEQEWSPIRWPWKSNTDKPEWHDRPRTFLFDDHLLAIGSTGWNWKNQESNWVGYDFDSLVGHAAGVSDEELERVVMAAPDFVDVIRSTRGIGRHLYIFFKPPYPKTLTHTEHAALARSFLPIMSSAAGFDFSTKMDVCGSILWLWHRDATTANRGFTTIKMAAKTLDASFVPPNWRDHLEVVTGSRTKVKVKGWTPDGQTKGDELDEDTQSYAVVELDEVHKRVLEDLEKSGYSFCWVHDHHLAQTHTQALKKVHDNWIAAGHPMKGPFATSSPDTDPSKVNCYIRPRVGGGWDVYRFGQVDEHPLWDRISGKTHVTLNCEPSLRQGTLAAGGVECADLKAGYQLPSEEALYKALKYLGSEFRMPQGNYEGKIFTLKVRPGDGRLILSVTRDKDDKELVGWEKKPKLWVKLLQDRVSTDQEEDRLVALWDNKIRVVKVVSMSEEGNVAGAFENWMLRDASNKWVRHPKEHIGLVVSAEGMPANMAAQILGWSVTNAWTKVNRPFEDEYPGGREWNYSAAQLAYKAASMEDGELPHHPHWDLVFNHCGSGLDKYIKDLPWCKDWGVKSGGDYLRAWVAAMLRFPYCRLPYLFMYSESQNTGKSTFHEAIRLLMTSGVVMADRALTSSQDFNGELSNAILGVIDEVDISKEGSTVYNKVKEWVTGLTIAVHAKYKEVYEQPSTLHLIQMSNNRNALPVFGGDSRITSMEVPIIDNEIGKIELMERLDEEGPHFMYTLMNVNLPKLQERMRVPVIETEDKRKAMTNNRSALEAFLEEVCSYSPGSAVLLQDLHAQFQGSLDKCEKSQWSKGVMRRELPDAFPVGRWNRNMTYVGNIAIGEPDPGEAKFILSGGQLVREN